MSRRNPYRTPTGMRRYGRAVRRTEMGYSGEYIEEGELCRIKKNRGARIFVVWDCNNLTAEHDARDIEDLGQRLHDEKGRPVQTG